MRKSYLFSGYHVFKFDHTRNGSRSWKSLSQLYNKPFFVQRAVFFLKTYSMEWKLCQENPQLASRAGGFLLIHDSVFLIPLLPRVLYSTELSDDSYLNFPWVFQLLFNPLSYILSHFFGV